MGFTQPLLQYYSVTVQELMMHHGVVQLYETFSPGLGVLVFAGQRIPQ